MRVISGKRKGKKLCGPKSNNIRPTEDRIKESMFNIISPIIEKATVLDLFAGTGSIGIEFLSINCGSFQAVSDFLKLHERLCVMHNS